MGPEQVLFTSYFRVVANVCRMRRVGSSHVTLSFGVHSLLLQEFIDVQLFALRTLSERQNVIWNVSEMSIHCVTLSVEAASCGRLFLGRDCLVDLHHRRIF